MPFAPGLFSMTMGWPSVAAIFSAKARPIWSVALPAAKGTSAFREIWSVAYRRRTIMVWTLWFFALLGFYGLTSWLGALMQQAGFAVTKSVLYTVLISLGGIPGFICAAWLVERWGRKPTLVGFLLLSAVGCMLYSLGNDPKLVVGSTLLLSFSLLGTWAALYAFTPEVYPTDLRASGMGTAGAVARFGGLFAPAIIAPVMASHFTLSLVMLSAFLVAGAVAILCVDVESRNRALE
jgi:putative MFS transporter